jgi:hypothetical protein
MVGECWLVGASTVWGRVSEGLIRFSRASHNLRAVQRDAMTTSENLEKMLENHGKHGDLIKKQTRI